MEKLRNTGSLGTISKDRKLRIVASFLVAGATLSATAQTEGKTPYVYVPTPYEEFHPLVLNETQVKERDLIVTIPLLLSEKEQEQIQIQTDLIQITDKMSLHPELFNDNKIEDVKMYYQIYKGAADKYDIDWFLLYIVHKAETGASRGERGFVKESYYVGAMQRDPNIWSDSYVRESADGLESLAELPQRHKSDWKEIAAAAHMLSDNFHKYEDQGDSKSEAVLKALLLYSADAPARNRFELYKQYNQVFKNEDEIFTPIKLYQ